MKIHHLILLLFLLHGATCLSQSADIRVHDPVMILEGDTYYLFCTGMGISVFSSTDMLNWKKQESVFKEIPAWTKEVVPDFKGHIWAPDISYSDGRYYLYYSISAFAKNTSAIGLAINKTLDPANPEFKWEDQGIVIQSVPNRDLWNAIDPNLVVDEDGTPWLTFGSFWEGLKLVRLTSDRRTIAQPQEWVTVAKRTRTPLTEDKSPGDAALEAPFIFRKDSMYFLFISWDYCCRGEKSDYKVVVGRSVEVKGPYFDKGGKSLAAGGGSLVVEGNENWAGAGHNSTYTFDGRDYLVFHAYDKQDGGKPKLVIRELKWDAEGWPMIDPSIK